MTIDPAIEYLLAFALAAVFGASGAMKLADLEMFEGAVANYRLLPHWLDKPFAYALPFCECACAAGLLFGPARAAAAAGLAGLLAMFTGAIGINLARGRTNIDCGCFGPALRQELSGWLVVRNLALIALAVALLAPVGARAIESIDLVTIAFGAASMVVLYAGANYAIGNAPRTRALEML
jgi:Methylamine utilisation protein MauE